MAIGFTKDGNEQQQTEDTIKDGINRVLNNTPLNNNPSIYCLKCEEEIPKGRRLLIKNVNYCLTCQESLDKLHNKPVTHNRSLR